MLFANRVIDFVIPVYGMTAWKDGSLAPALNLVPVVAYLKLGVSVYP